MKQLSKTVSPRNHTLRIIGTTGPAIEQIPFSVKGSRPLEGMRDPEDAARDVERKEEERERGLPVNPLTILVDKEGRQHAIGGLADPAKVPIERAADVAEQREKTWLPDRERWRNFYEDIRKLFGQRFRGKGEPERFSTGWLLTQRKAGPVAGVRQMLRAEDIRQGYPRGPVGAMGQAQVVQALSGETPSQGAGAKIHDFADSITGVPTRTWMGQDERGLQPVAGDTHAARAAGYVDQPMMNWIRDNWGDEVAKRFTVDLKSPTRGREGQAVGGGVPDRYQYERMNEFYNALKDEYNRRGVDQANDTMAAQVQALQWGAIGRSMGREMQLPAQMFDENLRRLAFETQPAPAAPYGMAFGPAWSDLPPRDQAALTRKVAEPLLDILRQETGGQQVQHFYGPGGYMGEIAPAGVVEMLASPEAAERGAALIGYLTQQNAVLESRPLYTGSSHWLELTEVGSSKLLDHENVARFWDAFRESFPDAEGFQPVREHGAPPGIRIIKLGGHMGLTSRVRGAGIVETPGGLETVARAASNAADAVGIKTMELRHAGADARMVENDWQKNPEGNQYLARLQALGRPGILHRVRDVYAPQIQQILESYLGRMRGRK